MKPYYFKNAIFVFIIYTFTIFPQTGQRNVAININNRTQNEPSIAVNPLNSSNLVAVWIDQSQGVRAGFGYSTDGGFSWNDGLLPSNIGGYRNQGDPSIVADKYGNFYYCFLSWFNGNSAIYVAKSSDGGKSWLEPVFVAGNDQDFFMDKPYIAVDLSSYSNNIYVTWTLADPCYIYFAKSIDNGKSFTRMKQISDRPSALGSSPTVGPDGTLYIAWFDYIDKVIKMDKSTDGGNNFGKDKIVSTVSPVESINLIERVNSFPCAVADPTNKNNVFVTWADNRYGNSDVLFTRSTDGGENWSYPMNVANNLAYPFINDQFFPCMCVRLNGDINICFYDRRDFPNNDSANVYLAESINHGSSFLPNIKVTDVGFNLASDPEFKGKCIGDYIGIAASPNNIFPIWTDTRNHNQDIYASPINGLSYISSSNESTENITTASLYQNFPNPFNPSTTIRYSIPRASFVTLKVYDIIGRQVASLVNEEEPAGNYQVRFNASLLASGTYIYKIQAGSFIQTKKMILLK